MTQVNRRPQMPSSVSCVSPVPGEVLFQRSVGAASVVATGSGSASKSRCVHSSEKSCTARVALNQGSGGSELDQRLSVRGVLSCLVTVASRTADTANQQSPKSMLPLVLKGLRKRAAAAKVSRGWRRLERKALTVRPLRSCVVASRSECSVASRSVRPVSCQLGRVQVRPVSVESRVLQ